MLLAVFASVSATIGSQDFKRVAILSVSTYCMQVWKVLDCFCFFRLQQDCLHPPVKNYMINNGVNNYYTALNVCALWFSRLVPF